MPFSRRICIATLTASWFEFCCLIRPAICSMIGCQSLTPLHAKQTAPANGETADTFLWHRGHEYTLSAASAIVEQGLFGKMCFVFWSCFGDKDWETHPMPATSKHPSEHRWSQHTISQNKCSMDVWQQKHYQWSPLKSKFCSWNCPVQDTGAASKRGEHARLTTKGCDDVVIVSFASDDGLLCDEVAVAQIRRGRQLCDDTTLMLEEGTMNAPAHSWSAFWWYYCGMAWISSCIPTICWIIWDYHSVLNLLFSVSREMISTENFELFIKKKESLWKHAVAFST